MVPYMIIPLGLTDEEEHVYIKLYKKCDFASMLVRYTVSQLVVDSYKGYNLTTKKVRKVLKNLTEKGYISEVKKGTKGNPTIYKMVKIQELVQYDEMKALKDKGSIDTEPVIKKQRQLKGSNVKCIDKELSFNEIWNLYPRKKGKNKAKIKVLKLLKEISKEELIRAVQRYAEETKNTQIEFIKHGDTFFNAAYEDYLDCNYKEQLNGTTYIPEATNFDY